VSNIFPGLSLIELPLRPSVKASQGLSAEEGRIATSLHENGYAIFYFSDAELDARIERIKSNLSPRYGIDFNNPHGDKTAGGHRIQDAWMFDEDVRAIASNESILGLRSKLCEHRAFPFQTLNFPVARSRKRHSSRANLLHGGSQQTNPSITCGSQVTQYSEDCIYYTAAFSDEAVERLDLRTPLVVSDGLTRDGSHLGENIKERPVSDVDHRSLSLR